MVLDVDALSKVAKPTFSPLGGAYNSTQNIVLSCSTSGATIRYTLDGSEPNALSTVYSNPISVNTNLTIKAKAFKVGMSNSDTVSATYIITTSLKVSTPTFSPAGGAYYSSSQNVALSCGTSGAMIRYTLDGSEPSVTSTLYSSPILVNANVTIKAKAFKVGISDSDTATATYTISFPKVSTPVLSPSGGTYNSSQSVVIACNTSGATIRYTLDGTEPTALSTIYSGPISVGSNGIINAKAFKTGMVDSDVASATYMFNASGFAEPISESRSLAWVFVIIVVVGIISLMLFLKRN